MKEKIKHKVFSKFSTLIVIFAAAIFSVMLIIYSKEVSTAVIASINSCMTVIIPSLFGFMAVSNIIIKSNIYVWLSKPFYPISKYILRIPPELFSVFILSNIGGYPIGAKLLCELLEEKKITDTDAESMMCCCFCSGPAFIIGAVGINIFSSVLTGFIIYISIVCSNFFIAAIMGLKREIPSSVKKKYNVHFSSDILIESVSSTIKTLTMICGMIIFFAVFIQVLKTSQLIVSMSELVSCIGISIENSNSIITSIIEISTVSGFSKFAYSFIPVITSLCAFGGICVIIQLSSITNSKIKMKRFIITRPFQIILSGAISWVLLNAFSKKIAIMTIYHPVITSERKSILPTIILIIMIILLFVKNNSRFLKKGMI